jgi:hypothetical protein
MASIPKRLRQRYWLVMPKNRKAVLGQLNTTRLPYDRIGRSVRFWPGSALMTSTLIRTSLTVAAIIALAGCQSAPRFSWWKKEATPDSSAVARSADTTLPSAQSTPQPVAVAGLTPAAPPSSTNLAAAGTPAATPNISTPVTSPATVANAPATAPPNAGANSLADKLTSAPTAVKPAATALTSAPTAAAVTSPTTAPTPQVAAVPSVGPYDPKGYKPASAYGSASADSATTAPGSAGRYGITSADRYSASAATTPETAPSQSFDRYGAPQASATPAAPTNNPLAAPAAAPSTDRYSVAPAAAASVQTSPVALATTPSAPPEITPSAAASPAIQLTSAPGQYRPGGTSSYTGASATRPVEIASRTAPATATPSAPAPAAAPAMSSEPWTPPASTAYPPTRTY